MVNLRIFDGLPVAFLLLAGCAERAPDTPRDKYDPAQMDFRSPPATITNERHSGAFSAGTSLSPGAALNRLDSAQIKAVLLCTG